mmetsp:Transcript_21296/g.64073  ORF Transcript_21296/g.64073 Transcript_21296/m.64073 type:complete len:428 (-) Transcript_21296:966-2249(-)
MAANDGLLAFVHEYMDQLADLTTAVKSKINSLSMLAAEEAAVTPAAASAVAAAIEKRIQTAEPSAKLPALYLLDSIVKNAGEPFVAIFARNLSQSFSAVWDASPGDRPTLERVLGTWPRVFPPRAIDAVRHHCGLAATPSAAPPAASAAASTGRSAATFSGALAQQPNGFHAISSPGRQPPGGAVALPPPVAQGAEVEAPRSAVGIHRPMVRATALQNQQRLQQPAPLPPQAQAPSQGQRQQPFDGRHQQQQMTYRPGSYQPAHNARPQNPQQTYGQPGQTYHLQPPQHGSQQESRYAQPQQRPSGYAPMHHHQHQHQHQKQLRQPQGVYQQGAGGGNSGGGLGGRPPREYQPEAAGLTFQPQQLSALQALLRALPGAQPALEGMQVAAGLRPSSPPLDQLWTSTALQVCERGPHGFCISYLVRCID